MLARTNRRGAAFTLVELLVVMAVIVILMTLLVPTLSAIRKQVKISKCKALIEGVSAALDEYSQMHGVYPPDKSANVSPDLDLSAECLVYYLSGASIAYDPSNPPAGYLWKHAVFHDTTGGGRMTAPIHYEFHHSDLMDGDGDKIPELKGAFGKRIIYNSGTGGSTSTDQYGKPKHRKGTFDLFFAGPDKRYDTDDDITNFKGTLKNQYEDYTLK